MYRSIQTVKADAARKYYPELGEDILWAVLSSGINARHPHFEAHDNLGGPAEDLHRDFTEDDPSIDSALDDPIGHGTQCAGILAGGLDPAFPRDRLEVYENTDTGSGEVTLARADVEPADISGLAPRCRLVSLRVLDGQGQGSTVTSIRALRYVRRDVNADGRLLRIHGVLVPVGWEFDPARFACGASPLCQEVERLVGSGVTVVVAAGNTGYAPINSIQRITTTGHLLTINDPGNAEAAITVGSTHRDMPHRFGVSYFSSKGPTADGRSKPDVVAPGEKVVSCAAGRALTNTPTELDNGAVYVENSGTSIASAHVAGVIAAFLSIHREFIGQPADVKRIILNSATSLGRREEFQGRGLVDLMRAIQSV